MRSVAMETIPGILLPGVSFESSRIDSLLTNLFSKRMEESTKEIGGKYSFQHVLFSFLFLFCSFCCTCNPSWLFVLLLSVRLIYKQWLVFKDRKSGGVHWLWYIFSSHFLLFYSIGLNGIKFDKNKISSTLHLKARRYTACFDFSTYSFIDFICIAA